jgi:Glycosyl transferase family 2
MATTDIPAKAVQERWPLLQRGAVGCDRYSAFAARYELIGRRTVNIQRMQRHTNGADAMATPWLTVIMPAYKGEQWIRFALDSLAAEADEGVEILLIDGSPTSATRDIALGYAERLRLRIVERPDLRSWHDKTNVAVGLSAAEHLCWLHVDDLWFPGRVSAVRDWIRAAPEAPLHLAPCAIIDKHGRKLGIWHCPLPKESKLPAGMVIERLLVQNFIGAPAPVFRKDAWLACGGLDEDLWYTADWDLWLKLAAIGPVYYHDKVTTGFRIHGSSLTVTGSRDADDFRLQMQIVLDRHLGLLGAQRTKVEPCARASITVNAALAAASAGRRGGLMHAASEVLRLGPSGIHRFLRDSRIVDRVAPRVRAKLRGEL